MQRQKYFIFRRNFTLITSVEITAKVEALKKAINLSAFIF